MTPTRELGTQAESAAAIAAAIAALPTSPLAAVNAYRHVAFGSRPLPEKHGGTPWASSWPSQVDQENLRMDARFLLADVMATHTLPHTSLGLAVAAAAYGLTDPAKRPPWHGPAVPTSTEEWALELVHRVCDLLRSALGERSAQLLVDEMANALINPLGEPKAQR